MGFQGVKMTKNTVENGLSGGKNDQKYPNFTFFSLFRV